MIDIVYIYLYWFALGFGARQASAEFRPKEDASTVEQSRRPSIWSLLRHITAAQGLTLRLRTLRARVFSDFTLYPWDYTQ